MKVVHNPPDLSVILLCYASGENSVSYVHSVRETLHATGINFELILVANFDRGAADRTPLIMKELAANDQRLIAVSEEKQGRMGWDLRQGLLKAGGRVILFMDGDGQTPPDDILRLYRTMQTQQLEFCKIYRSARADGTARKILSFCFKMLFSLIFPGTLVKDVNAKPKAILRAVYEKMNLTSDDWFIDAEIILEARRLKLKALEIPGIFLKNNWRASFVGGRAVLEFLNNLVRYRLRYWFLR